MWSTSRIYIRTIYINGLNFVFNIATTIHFADGTHLIYVSKKLSTIESVIIYETLSPVQNVDYLGVFLDEFLSWEAYVNNLCKKLAQTNGILSKLRHYVP